jgi:hypothetical protein
MNMALARKRFMAAIAKIGRVLGELEGSLALLRMWGRDGLVTALAGFGDCVDRRRFQELCVALL